MSESLPGMPAAAPTPGRAAREAYYHPHHADGDARWEAVASAVASELAEVTAERDALRVLLGRRDALIARLLGMFGRGSDGMRARMSIVTYVRCKRDAGYEISDEEKRMAGG